MHIKLVARYSALLAYLVFASTISDVAALPTKRAAVVTLPLHPVPPSNTDLHPQIVSVALPI